MTNALEYIITIGLVITAVICAWCYSRPVIFCWIKLINVLKGLFFALILADIFLQVILTCKRCFDKWRYTKQWAWEQNHSHWQRDFRKNWRYRGLIATKNLSNVNFKQIKSELKEPYAILLLSADQKIVDIRTSSDNLGFDKDQVLSVIPGKGTIIPVLVSVKKTATKHLDTFKRLCWYHWADSI